MYLGISASIRWCDMMYTFEGGMEGGRERRGETQRLQDCKTDTVHRSQSGYGGGVERKERIRYLYIFAVYSLYDMSYRLGASRWMPREKTCDIVVISIIDQ